MVESPSAPPSFALLMLEARAVAELAAFFSFAPMLRLAPRGDGHPVLVLPGLSAGDASTAPLRWFLRDRGYRAYGWSQGLNRGPRPGVEDSIRSRLAELADRYGRKVSLVGWSLGGVFARELARAEPQLVRSVISLGSGFGIQPTATNAGPVYEALSGHRIDQWVSHEQRELMRQPPPVPSTSIYSRTDGVVAWQGCLEREGPQSENIEVECSHSGLGFHPAALYAVADRLAQPEGEWKPFVRSGLRSYVFPDPRRESAWDGFPFRFPV